MTETEAQLVFDLGRTFNPIEPLTKERELGEKAGEILRHAVSKQAEVSDLELQARKLGRMAMANSDPFDIHNTRRSIERELERQRDKLAMRKRKAVNVVSAGLEIRTTNPDDAADVHQGILTGLDLGRAILELKPNDGNESVEAVGFATNLPIPERLRRSQTYFGHELAVVLEVLSVPPEYAWVLH